jgi:c-di-GMP-binding flagellar brake protein YcgR
MKPRRIISPEETWEVLDAGVRENALAVLAVQNDDQWLTFKSRFLERDPQRKFVVLDYAESGDRPPPPLAPGQYVGISFRHKSRKIMFASVVEARGKFVVGNQQSVAAVRYRWPDSLTELQRRAYHRTPVPAGTSLLVSAWPGGCAAWQAAQTRSLQIVNGQAIDISCGGTLIRINEPNPPDWREDLTLGVEIQLPDGRDPLLVDAYYRGARHSPDGALCLGLQFVGLELSFDGRAVLQRLARCVQRFHRLTVVKGVRGEGGLARFRTA